MIYWNQCRNKHERPHELVGAPFVKKVGAIKNAMFKAIGLFISLYALSVFFGEAFPAFEDAAVATFETIEVAAEVSQVKLQELN